MPDLGSAGPALLPGTHLLVAGGKEGRMYLLDGRRPGPRPEAVALSRST